MNSDEIAPMASALIAAVIIIVAGLFVLTGGNDTLDVTPDENGVITIPEGKVIDSNSLNKIKEEASNDSSVTLNMKSGDTTVVLDSEAIGNLNSSAALSSQKLETSSLSDTEKAIVGDRPVYQITFGNNKDFGTGTATISVPYELQPGESADDILIYYMDQDSILETKTATYADGMITFSTNHLSKYVVGTKDGYDEYISGNGYYFFIYFGDNDVKNGWYNGVGPDASAAFGNAMDKAGFSYTVAYGYLSTIAGVSSMWMTYGYIYEKYDSDANSNSILYPAYSDMGGYTIFNKSNGWVSIVGYGSGDELKYSQLNMKTYIISAYGATENDPIVISDAWSSSGPFQTAPVSKPIEKEYSFFLYFGPGDTRTNWYTASGTDATAAFDAAMTAANMDYVVNDGYLSSIDGVASMWMTYGYMYTASDATAFNASVGYPLYTGGQYSMFLKSNGWVSIAGYNVAGDSGLKYYQFNSDRYVISVYGATENDPTIIESFWNTYSENQKTYNFYVYFGENQTKNGWYSAKAVNAASGFAKAMTDAGMSYMIGSNGYVSSINEVSGFWMTYAYQYRAFSSVAATASINAPAFSEGYPLFLKSDGWVSISGYDQEGVNFKLSQLDYTTFVLTLYGNSEVTPVDIKDAWSASGPFADSTPTPVVVED